MVRRESRSVCVLSSCESTLSWNPSFFLSDSLVENYFLEQGKSGLLLEKGALKFLSILFALLFFYPHHLHKRIRKERWEQKCPVFETSSERNERREGKERSNFFFIARVDQTLLSSGSIRRRVFREETIFLSSPLFFSPVKKVVEVKKIFSDTGTGENWTKDFWEGEESLTQAKFPDPLFFSWTFVFSLF